MSGFAASWLALREPFDARARDPGLAAALASRLADRQEIRIVDLGSGTGSNLRWLAPRLAGRQRWRLIEHDPTLIAAGESLLRREGTVDWSFIEADLSAGLEAVLDEGCDLVTCSALLDLVSSAWLERLAGAVSVRGAALYASLTYDGRIGLQPPLEGDTEVTALADAHQRTDKGFGPALGPDAAPALGRLLGGCGGRVLCSASDWVLAPDERAIQEALVRGWAGAAIAMAPGEAAPVAAWQAGRLALLDAGRGRCLVGHRDLLWLPGRSRDGL